MERCLRGRRETLGRVTIATREDAEKKALEKCARDDGLLVWVNLTGEIVCES